MKSKYSAVFAMVKQINESGAGNITHKELVKDFTGGRTESLNDLSAMEFEDFSSSLRRTIQNSKNTKSYQDDPLDKTRKAIISQFKSIGRSTADAIAWAERYGVRGQKKTFNSYNGQELYILLRNARKMKADFLKSLHKKLH